MRIHLLAVGTRMPGWVKTAYADYALSLIHISEPTRPY